MVVQNKSYKFRIYPNQEQEEILAKMFGCSRFVWNYFLNLEKENHSKPKEEKVKNYLVYLLETRKENVFLL